MATATIQTSCISAELTSPCCMRTDASPGIMCSEETKGVEELTLEMLRFSRTLSMRRHAWSTTRNKLLRTDVKSLSECNSVGLDRQKVLRLHFKCGSKKVARSACRLETVGNTGKKSLQIEASGTDKRQGRSKSRRDRRSVACRSGCRCSSSS